MKKGLINIVLVTLISSTLFAKANKELVKEYMQISGTTQTIEDLSTQITVGVEQSSAIYGKKPDRKRLKILKKVFSPDESLSVVESYLSKHFDNKTLKNIIGFYKSPVGEDITQAALQAQSPNNQSELLRFVADLRENPPSKKRVATINSFIDTLEMDKVVEDMFFEMFDALNAHAPKEKKITSKKRDRFIELLNSEFEKQIFLSTLYTYQDISDDELYKAIKYFNSNSGEKEKKIVREAIRQMIKSGFKRAFMK